MDPVSFMKCAYEAISPLKLDDIVGFIGNEMKAITDDEVDFLIDYGENLVTSMINDATDCYKGFTGQATTCSDLHIVHSCINSALDVLPVAEKASEFAKLSTENLGKAEKALNIINNDILPALDQQCVNGCLGETSCNNTPISTTPCPASESATNSSQEYETPITLIYGPPAGCTCQSLTMTLYTQDSIAKSIDLCAHNIAFYLTDSTTLMQKAYLSEMGCFVGKTQPSTCPGAYMLTESDIDMDEFTSSDVGLMYFVPCLDQYNRTFSRRQEPLPSTPTPSPSPVACTTRTTTTSTSTTGSKPSNAPLSVRAFGLFMATLLAFNFLWV